MSHVYLAKSRQAKLGTYQLNESQRNIGLTTQSQLNVYNQQQKNIRMSANSTSKKSEMSCLKLTLAVFISLLIIIISQNISIDVSEDLNSSFMSLPDVQKQISCIFVGLGSSNTIRQSIQSFFRHNDHQTIKLLAIVKQIPNQITLMQQSAKIIWLTIQQYSSLYSRLDKTIAQQKSEYIFYFDDQWEFLRNKFITNSLALMEQFSQINQVLLYNSPQQKDNQTLSRIQGFSFSPGLHRKSDLLSINGGFKHIYEYIMNNNLNLSVETALSNMFINSHKFAKETEHNYARKIKNSVSLEYKKIHYSKVNNKQMAVKILNMDTNQKSVKPRQAQKPLQQSGNSAPFDDKSKKIQLQKQLEKAEFKSKDLAKLQGNVQKTQQDYKYIRIRKQPKQEQSLTQKSKTWNNQNQNYITGLQKYSIKVSDLSQRFRAPNPQLRYIINLTQYGLSQDVQVGSFFDYLNISQTKQFKQMKAEWQSTIPYNVMNFQEFSQLIQPQQITMYDQLPNYQKAIEFLNQQATKRAGRSYNKQLNMAILLLAQQSQKYKIQLIKQAQYMFFSQKYKIQKAQRQLPICIFSSLQGPIKSVDYEGYLLSIERQNYTNYRLVIVDDNAELNSSDFLYSYLGPKQYKLKKRVQIVQNIAKIGQLGSQYVRIKQFCKESEVVIILDLGDKLIGTQVLKIINKVYQDPQIWYAYSKMIQHEVVKSGRYWKFSAASADIANIQISRYRSLVNIWQTSHLKTFRYSLMSKAPIQYFIQYRFNPQNQRLQPSFYKQASDRFLIYTLLQMSDKNRIFFISDGLYYFNHTSYYTEQRCKKELEQYDELKSRIKIPLNRLRSLNDEPTQLQNYQYPQSILSTLKGRFKIYVQCQQSKQKQNQINHQMRVKYEVQNLQYFELSYQIQQILKNKYGCKKFTTIGRNFEVKPQQITNYVSLLRSTEEKVSRYNNRVAKCGIVKYKQLKVQFLQYYEFQYLIIEGSKNSLVQQQIIKIIEGKRRSQAYELQLERQGQIKYVVLKYLKVPQMQKQPQVKKIPQYLFDAQFSKKLKDFYRKQNAKTIMEFGCGKCEYITDLKQSGFNADGYCSDVYQIKQGRQCLRQVDVTQKQNLNTEYDWSQSFIIGQHVPEMKTNTFLSNIVKHTKSGVILIWSANERVQNGQQMNRKSDNQLIVMFRNNGFQYDVQSTNQFKKDITGIKLFIFRRT